MTHRVRSRNRRQRSARGRWLTVAVVVAVAAAMAVVELASHQAAQQRVAGASLQPVSGSQQSAIGTIIPAVPKQRLRGHLSGFGSAGV
jgi:hypothetical protein